MNKSLHERTRIILVNPRIPENVGSVARSMMAFGFSQLLFVNPAFTHDPLGPAAKTASGADDLLDQTQVVPQLFDAIHDVEHVIGFSRREHHFKRPHVELSDWIQHVNDNSSNDQWALLFGSENFGLLNEDKVHCECLVSIPQNHPSMSLNLSHAVTVVLYELYQKVSIKHEAFNDSTHITQEQTQRILDEIISRLEASNYFKPGRRERQVEFLRDLIHRLDLKQEEFHSVMGLLKSLNNT